MKVGMTKQINRRCTQIHADTVIGVYRVIVVSILCLPAFAAVDGTVINQTTGKPQSGATVTLYKLGQAGMESVESVKSDAQGKFRIDQTPQGPHLIQTAYDGVTYNHMLPPGSPTAGISLEVYNSSKQPGAAHVVAAFSDFPAQRRADDRQRRLHLHERRHDHLQRPGRRHAEVLPARRRPKASSQVKATAPQACRSIVPRIRPARPDVYKVDFPIKPGETSFK